uniref:Dual specificity phosphatase 21 n=1 Tax=Aquila chrysaetos chrysaetos TaxID=223781 RepID=A0A663DVM9_AQUCH
GADTFTFFSSSTHPNGSGFGSPAPAPQITSILYLGDTVATNSHLLLFSHRISTVIHNPGGGEHALSRRRVPAHPRDGWPCRPHLQHGDTWGLDTAALHCWGEQVPTVCLVCLLKHHSTSLAGAHAWVESCCPIIRPNNSFWQRLIHYEYKLFGVNRLQMVSSLSGMIPHVYENEVRVMLSMPEH